MSADFSPICASHCPLHQCADGLRFTKIGFWGGSRIIQSMHADSNQFLAEKMSGWKRIRLMPVPCQLFLVLQERETNDGLLCRGIFILLMNPKSSFEHGKNLSRTYWTNAFLSKMSSRRLSSSCSTQKSCSPHDEEGATTQNSKTGAQRSNWGSRGRSGGTSRDGSVPSSTWRQSFNLKASSQKTNKRQPLLFFWPCFSLPVNMWCLCAYWCAKKNCRWKDGTKKMQVLLVFPLKGCEKIYKKKCNSDLSRAEIESATFR